ncbi:MAG: Ig-like domain-containing protein, partial [Anaerolineae bacterium]|nr:Ig-like domain-containing protein [Anaerolineae bacterium]
MNRFRSLLGRSLVLVLGALLLLLAGRTLAQDQDQNPVEQLPPHVIDVWPYPGEEVLTDQPITITFDQPMDTASVETAWQMTPAASGQFNWTSDNVLEFLPDDGWQRATRYEVTIGTGATAANGLALEEAYQFHVQVIGYLEVATVIPAADATGVQADATITVSFNRPVVPLVSTEQLDELPVPITIDPAIAGKGKWLNTSIFMFTPDKPLAGGMTYTVTVNAGLTDFLGAVLNESYSWQFKTLPPEILNVSPWNGETGVRLEAAVSVQFSQPMDPASTGEAFMLLHNGAQVAGSITWSDDGRWLTFTPDANLQIEAQYLINIAASARSASGEATLETGISYSFNTVPYPGIEYTNPANGERDVYPGGGAYIQFKSPMNTDTFAGKTEIVTPEGVVWEPRVTGDSYLYLEFASEPETTYTIRFKRGAEDVYGNAIDTDYTFSYTTSKVEPSAYLPSRQNFMITNAYRENTRIALGVTGKPEVSFILHTIPTEYIGQAMRNSYDYETIVKLATLQRAWTQTLSPGALQSGAAEVFLASETGGQLAHGVYYLQALAPNYNYPQTLSLGVVTANLTVKRSADDMLIWVTDIESAEPVANVPVTLYRDNGEILTRGATGDDGVFRAPVDLDHIDNFVYAVAQNDTTYGVWMSWNEPELENNATYIYTERPIYRPGETVYFRGAVRDRDDMTYTVPAGDTVHVNIQLYDQQVFDADLPLSEFGTFNGEIKLADDAPIGYGYIQVTYQGDYSGAIEFQVAEFRVPEYKVEVTPDYDVITQGDSLKAVIAASYYFGGPVSNADLNWNAYGESAWFNYTGPGRYNFSDETQDYFGWVDLGSASVTTDANGQVIANLTNIQAPAIRPMTISIEGTTYDESGQYISGRASVLAHPADVYVGLRTDRYFGRAEQPMTVDLIAVTTASEPIANQKIELNVVEVRWERVPVEGEYGRYSWNQTEIEVATAEVITGDDGLAQYAFTPPQAGIYRVRALTRDLRERVNSSSVRVWVTGSQPVWWGRPSNTIDLIADKDGYQPGDTAQVLVPIPFSGVSHVLLTVERAGIEQYEVFRVEGSTLLYELPITEDHVPTVHVTATLMKGTDEENLNPLYRTGTLALEIEPVNQRVHVTITPSATLAQPGDTVTFDIKTTDARGEPVSTEVGVTLTDAAILSLAAPNSGTLEDHFYGYQYNRVQTNVALDALLDIMIDELVEEQEKREAAFAMDSDMATNGAAAPGMWMADGMVANEATMPDTGGGGGTVDIRTDFQQTPLWEPRVVTDVSGEGSVSVTLPDNLTTWHLDARGLTVDTRVGDAELDVMSTLPLLTRPVTPRFFVVGDRVVLASVINNNTNAPQTIEATLEATGVTFESDQTQVVTIEAESRARVEWTVVIEDVPNVDLTFFAIGENGYQDAAKPTLATGPDGTIPVYRYTAPDTVGTGGLLRTDGTRTEAISLPPRLDVDQGELTIHLDPSLAVTTVDALDYLQNYEHQCIEQTVSRFLPNVMTYRALRDLGIDDPKLKEKLQNALDYALNRLKNEQNPDGGWGWFGNMESNPYITAYAALGLIEARDAGFAIDPTMINAALNFVRTDLVRPTIDTPTYLLNRQAFYLYVFARNKQTPVIELDKLLDHRLDMDYWSRSFLLMAYHEVDPANSAVTQLVSDLQTGAILSATGGHWEENERDWWNWSSDTRTTAMALTALTRVQPDMDILPNVVRWLMVARQGDHWETTQETAWAVMALTDWMVSTGELQGNYDYALTLNGAALTEGQVTPETVREGEV